MDDDAADWLSEAVNEPEPAPAEAPKAAASTTAKADAPAEALVDEAVAEVEESQPEAGEYLDPDKLLLFKHWIRPKFLQYNYLYDYRRNYYDDVIDYLDKRQRGLSRDVPRAQTWAERALRTRKVNIYRDVVFIAKGNNHSQEGKRHKKLENKYETLEEEQSLLNGPENNEENSQELNENRR
ncbi:hypothetical protein RN001_010256 [Aquatica leii]|uniref:Flightin n=1 Tax=Aquatica leii TaxID=1421715 RepID=A0AAN7P0N0_9COLE|nr:hypothetical protein RN001_010256 [Aquatica leii]